jgi:hypothetical protein
MCPYSHPHAGTLFASGIAALKTTTTAGTVGKLLVVRIVDAEDDSATGAI